MPKRARLLNRTGDKRNRLSKGKYMPKDRSTELARIRQYYAEEIQAVANIRSPAIVQALATVPREKFLGPGPWRILSGGLGGFDYRTTEDADPRHLYHNVLVAIDSMRKLNNGQPSFLAFCLDALDLAVGDHALHIGCGVGYYTAIMAAAVGGAGRVTAIEIDSGLAARARANLSDLEQINVIAGDGLYLERNSANAIFVNAGATHPLATWLDALKPGGRLILPLTADESGRGALLKVMRTVEDFGAVFLSDVAIFPCTGARDTAIGKLLAEAFRRGARDSVQSLRREPHESGPTCWLHSEQFCLSTLGPKIVVNKKLD